MKKLLTYVPAAIAFATVTALAVWPDFFVVEHKTTSSALTSSELVIDGEPAPKTYTFPDINSPDLSAAFHETENSFFNLGAQIGAQCGMLYALGKETDVQECIDHKKNQVFAEINGRQVGSPSPTKPAGTRHP